MMAKAYTSLDELAQIGYHRMKGYIFYECLPNKGHSLVMYDQL